MGGDQERQASMAQERPRRATPRPRSGAAAKRSYPTPKVRDADREEQPYVQGAARVQAGRKELLYIQGWGGAGVRRYPWSKVRSRGCALLEQP